MKKAPILTCAITAAAGLVWALTATGDSPPEPQMPDRAGDAEPSPGAEDRNQAQAQAARILSRARSSLRSYRTVRAKLIETVDLGGRKFQVSGTYLQASHHRLRLALDIRLGKQGDFHGSMLQVCDGQVLWTSHLIGPKSGRADSGRSSRSLEQRITRRDVQQILLEAEKHREVPQNVLVAELGLGGLSQLLASLEKTVEFDTVQEKQADGNSLIILHGRWNRSVLDHFLDDSASDGLRQAERESPPDLPRHVPEAVRVYFDRRSLFLRRVLYLKRDGSDSFRPMVSLTFADVVLNGPVDDGEFNFVPPDQVVPQDVTPQYLNQLQTASSRQIKVESSKAKVESRNDAGF